MNRRNFLKIFLIVNIFGLSKFKFLKEKEDKFIFKADWLINENDII